MDNTLLGLAKKAGRLEIGGDSVEHAARLGKARSFYRPRTRPTAQNGGPDFTPNDTDFLHLVLPSEKEELGAIVGRGSPGMITILDAGLAAKYVAALAQTDPEKYGPAATQLEEKAARIRMRRKKNSAAGAKQTIWQGGGRHYEHDV